MGPVLEWKLPERQMVCRRHDESCPITAWTIRSNNGRGEKTAILWEGEPEASAGKGGEIRRITFEQLRDQVCRFANGLKKLGVKKGTRVTIYMPMVPEAAVAMLACARLGAPHSVIFGGFSSQAIADRVEDAKSEIVITADGGRRRGQVVAAQAQRRRGRQKNRRC